MRILGSDKALWLFIVKLVGVYVAWFVFYELWMRPDGRLDAWMSEGVAGASAGLLGLLGYPAFSHGQILWITGTQGIDVVAGCNALAQIGLFLGFVLAYPGAARRRAAFVPLGIVVLWLANVTRISVLALVQLYRPAAFDVAHELAAKPLFYLLVFVLWAVWAQYSRPPSPERPSPPKAAARISYGV